ncbi:MAG TPA: hypothetical protein HA359_05455 [Candidatus Poseidoniaceae archaeon]|nr:MAG TPA: hypothetical protein D7H84_05440 [Candidatus Poseidoniales archaeon]DAC59704.1 MAG TPA: hypothetical protein D7I03_03680 [Candidatus Poseidoniales archaeon]HII23684.1 hypothetical protein [Candidatus Poseidoniaceae archaeon]HII50420.1 hypothetical protein [Candidatus Poseidoniaceae archaeon]|tara:strand:- start:438 stop:1067 length:630 start_codon:yes stop_codon:yes gene_type:complete
MAVPKGLITFDKLDLCLPYKRQLQIIIAVSSATTIIGLILTLFAGFSILISLICLALSVIIFALFGYETMALVKIPLAVNMNHPFVEEEPIGKATVHVKLSNDEWQELGKHRIRIIKDELIGGYNLVEDFEDYKVIGHYSHSNKKPRIMKQIIIINQALSLRDGVNGVEDPIEDARERENLDYGLLERKWLDEEELTAEGPLAKLINKD